MRLFSIFCLVLSLFASGAPDAQAASSSTPGGMTLLDFRVSAIGALQSGGNGISAQLAWNPKYRMTDRLLAGLHLGGTYLPAIGGGGFVAAEYALVGNYTLNPQLFAEFGAGAQTWFNSSSSTALEILAGGGMHLDKKYFNLIDTVFVQYGLFLQSPLTHVIKLGVQVSL